MLGKLLSAVIETAKLPTDIVKDVFTCCDEFHNQKGSYTARRVNKIQDKLED